MRLVETTGDVRGSSFVFQQIVVAVQQFNSVLLFYWWRPAYN